MLFGRNYLTQLEKVSDQAIKEIASSIADAIAALHKLLHQATSHLQVPTAQENLEMLAKETAGLRNSDWYVIQLREKLKALRTEATPIIHGDCNISNLLFAGNTVCAAVDFAEVRRGFYEEDLAAIIAELPHYKSALIAAFESYSGCSVNESQLNYGLALNAFISYAISSRAGNELLSAVCRESLEKFLKTC
ncbi:MAG: phosphotransferase [Cyanobacteria bacterium J06621_11]